MTLGDQMSKMSLARPDPVSEALKKGQMPTLGEVKRSIKVHYTPGAGDLSFEALLISGNDQVAYNDHHSDGKPSKCVSLLFFY